MPSWTALQLTPVAFLLILPGVFAYPPRPVVVKDANSLLPAYDYVVVGGGLSGLVVANRLSENPAVTVLVIEAGSFDKDEDFVTIPGLAGGAVGTQYDWNTTYAANEFLGDRVVAIPQGKVVGGSTKLNRMVFDRGSQSDYDAWAAVGNEGWDWETLLPYFQKTETFTPPTPEIQAEYNITWDDAAHGTSGYIQTSYSPFFWPSYKNIIAATQELGIPIAEDQANGSPIGGYFCPHNLDPKTLTRSSAEEAYYNTAVSRTNFHLIANNRVTRLRTRNVRGAVTVTNVEFTTAQGVQSKSVGVRKDAILAAGSLHTPQLLQLSGIGDPAHLSTINVTTVVDLPAVGQNLHDHVSVVVVAPLGNGPVGPSALTSNATFAAEARAQYDAERKGPLTSPTGDFLHFLPLSLLSDAADAIQAEATAQDPSAHLLPGTPDSVAQGYSALHAELAEKLSSPDSAVMEYIWADDVIVVGLQKPFSRGNVKATSGNVFDAPIAESGFLSNPLDVTLLREGIRFARKIHAAPSIAALAPFEVAPGANVTADADLDAFIRGSAATLFHPCGTAKLGAREDGGVVDNDLKVYGVKGLRVVDASIMPIHPAAHSMTTVYAVAERAADLIKAGNGY
ncbi:hypothetical protein F5X68DRAFT_240578 [Plectosphaerella plurivora]|uniref:Glucose-methanol-choline oxidoreductase N-terminal domain-containing protein n=1 Tax=Plectosphaerella plurivora TaxID=936078 RepID=A0A9P8VAS3_9PEZI|nr:hypothetical protein F5X68DRAFT_240578 [Plectosphaerella plurivora]